MSYPSKSAPSSCSLAFINGSSLAIKRTLKTSDNGTLYDSAASPPVHSRASLTSSRAMDGISQRTHRHRKYLYLLNK
ncbi:unnamed protein product [Nesidiocoris tenuis]|uniref:Uncharacterized protein n=1 Tax=Nesidiocoris tenuis TaxID=355587 RepID=A0A6H5GP45_9HEMI|nr:unnamed protein product [Nesidiocoris tenuis]